MNTEHYLYTTTDLLIVDTQAGTAMYDAKTLSADELAELLPFDIEVLKANPVSEQQALARIMTARKKAAQDSIDWPFHTLDAACIEEMDYEMYGHDIKPGQIQLVAPGWRAIALHEDDGMTVSVSGYFMGDSEGGETD